MPRNRLDPADAYPFSSRMVVRVGDINYGNHLANDALVGLVHQARMEMLRQLTVSETNLGDGETGLIMSDLTVNFRQEAFLFDELVIETAPAEVTGRSFRLRHRVLRGEETIALVECGFMGYNYHLHRPARLPATFTAALLPH